MKYLKRYESVEDTDSIDWKEEFESISPLFIDLIDEFNVNIRFMTADGSMKWLSYDDYLKKGNNYDRFILALSGMTVEFEIKIDLLDKDYDVFISLMQKIKSISERIEKCGWNLLEFESKVFSKITFQRCPYMIRCKFKYTDERVHGKKRTYHLTGE